MTGTHKQMKTEEKKMDKEDFWLSEAEAAIFEYREYYFISEIRSELNRIIDTKVKKRITLPEIWKFLCDEGYVEERIKNGESAKVPTEFGFEVGIQLIEQESESGYPYNLLKYPANIQKNMWYYLIFTKNLL